MTFCLSPPAPSLPIPLPAGHLHKLPLRGKSNTYAMPMAGWFQYVSGPHYLAEVLIYASLYLLAGQRARGIGQGYQLMLTWVFSNQALVAGRTHTWYQTKFKDYPRDRRRLVPGVW